MYLTVYENCTYGTGLITTVNTTARTVVIGGTQYTYGIDTYPGANVAPANQTGVNTTLVGKQVNYILADGIVVRVYDTASAATYIVFDNLTGLTAQGYATALAYVQSNKASVITIATINGYSYQQYYMFANNHSLNSITDDLQTGELFEGTKDALGFWHLKTIDYTYYTKENNAEITFNNGIANLPFGDQFYYKNGALKAFNQFNTSASTVYVVYDNNNDDGTFYTAIGTPVDGAQIEVHGSMYVVLAAPPTNGPTAAFVYVFDGKLEGEYHSDAWKSYAYDTIIYVDGSTTATQVTNNLGTTGSLLGYTWQYSNVVDMLRGGWTTVQTLYNMQLETGCFYTVSNGYVEDKVDIKAHEAPIKEGLLSKIGTFYSVIDLKADDVDLDDHNAENSAYTYLYRLEGNKVVINPADGSIINQVNDAAVVNAINAANSYTPVYFYAGDVPGSRVILYLSNSTSNVVNIVTSGPYTNAFANVDLTAAAYTNYYSVDEAAYLAITANHTRTHFIYNFDVKDRWMRLYDEKGKEVTDNWEVEFTTEIDPMFRTPIYTAGIQKDTVGKLGDGIKDYTLKFLYNNIVYVMPLANLQLTGATAAPVTEVTGVTLSGAAVVGSTLTAAVVPSTATVTYKWEWCETIDGTYHEFAPTTETTYKILPVLNHGIYIKVTATGTGDYAGTSATSTVVGPMTTPITAFTINVPGINNPTVGSQLTTVIEPSAAAAHGDYQWYRSTTVNGSWFTIDDATDSFYTPTSTDVGYYLKVVVTGKDGYTGTFTSVTTAAVVAAPIA
jgi:hypothetical protein